MFMRLLFLISMCCCTPLSHAAVISYAYDSLNRLTNVNYGNGSVISYTYDAAGNRLAYSGVVANDTVAPTIVITNPTSSSYFTNSSATINLSGTAADNTGVTLVTWYNYNDLGVGDANGTNSWSISGIPLEVGDNLIDVIAYDAAGNTGDAFLEVIYTPPAAPVLHVGTTGNNLNLSWPIASAGGFTLQYADSLTPPILWSNVVTIVTTNSDTLSITLPATNSQRFFRLMQP
jgi:YD repeat-containing protein